MMIDPFQFQPVDTDCGETNSNHSPGVFLPLSPLFDAAVDDDYLAVQSLLIKNYDANTKVE